jgi:hypothetical protein
VSVQHAAQLTNWQLAGCCGVVCEWGMYMCVKMHVCVCVWGSLDACLHDALPMQ